MNQVIDIIGRVAGRPLEVRREPAQKGDMRDTYADTSLARADLGLRRASRSNKELKRSIDGFRPHPCAHESPRAVSVVVCAARWSSRRGVCVSAPKKPPVGAARARQVPLRARHRGAEREALARRRASTSGSWSTAIRRARTAPTRSSGSATLPRRRHAEVAASWRSTSTASSCRSTRRTSAPTTRSSSWGWRTSTRCAGRSATRPRRGRRSRELTTSTCSAIRTSHCCARSGDSGCARRRTA